MKLNSILKLSSLAIVSLGLVSTVALTTTSCGERTDDEKTYKSVDEYLQLHAVKLPEAKSQSLRATSNPYDFSALETDSSEILSFISNNWTNQLIFNSVIFSATYSTRQPGLPLTVKENKITDKVVDVDVTSTYEGREDRSGTMNIVYQLTAAGVVGHLVNKKNPDEKLDVVFSIVNNQFSAVDNGDVVSCSPTDGSAVNGEYKDPITSFPFPNVNFKTVAIASADSSYTMEFPISMYDWKDVIFPSASAAGSDA